MAPDRMTRIIENFAAIVCFGGFIFFTSLVVYSIIFILLIQHFVDVYFLLFLLIVEGVAVIFLYGGLNVMNLNNR